MRVIAVGIVVSAAASVSGMAAADAEETVMTTQEFHDSRQFVETRFGKIAYVEQGNGPVALFVHGALLNGYQWRYQLAALSDLRRCIALDTMGMGYTEFDASQDLSMKSQAEMIEAFLDALGIDRVDLVGNDSGGGIAQIFAARNPGRVRSLTLTNCEVHEYDKDNPMSAQLEQLITSGGLLESLKLVVSDPEIGKTALMVAYENPDALDNDALLTFFEPLISSEARIQAFQDYFLATTSADLLEVDQELKSLKAPVLVMWGLADTFFAVKWAHWLKDNLPNVREVVELEGAKVFFPEERPEIVNAKLREFWTAK